MCLRAQCDGPAATAHQHINTVVGNLLELENTNMHLLKVEKHERKQVGAWKIWKSGKPENLENLENWLGVCFGWGSLFQTLWGSG